MDEELMPIVVLAVIMCGLIGAVIYIEMQPPTPINSGDVYKYLNMKVVTTVTVDHYVIERMELDFFILIPISCGKGCITFIPVPVYEDYEVYKVKEGFYVAVEKDSKVTLEPGVSYTIIGDVKQDRDKHLYCIMVREVKVVT